MAEVNSIKLIDRMIGYIICCILSFFKRKNLRPANPNEILFIQLWGIGETVLTLPAIEAVQEKFDGIVTVLVTDRNQAIYQAADINTEILSLNPFKILFFIFTHLGKYDLVFDLEEYLNISAIISFFVGKYIVGFDHGIRARLYNESVYYNPNQHVINTFLHQVQNYVGEDDIGAVPKLKYNFTAEYFIDGFLQGKNNKLIGMVPGSAESGKARMWPAEKFIELCSQLTQQDCTLIFIGTKEENPLIESIIAQIKQKEKILNLAGKTSLEDLFCLIDRLDLLITNDTGPLHIASAQQTNTIGLFGPNTPKRFGPLYGTAIYHPSACLFSPCINVHMGKVPDCLYRKNNEGYQQCMKAIHVNEILENIKKFI